MPKTLCDLVGGRVHFHRTDQGYPRRVIAEKTDISERYLAQLEGGDANISILLLERIADALEVPLTELIKTRGQRTIKRDLYKMIARMDAQDQDEALEVLENHFKDAR